MFFSIHDWPPYSVTTANAGLPKFCFDSELEYDDFVENRVLRLDESEPHFSFIANTVLSGIWRGNEYQPDEDESESGDGVENRTKNTTDATRLTMDHALRIFSGLRSLGLRRE